MLVDCDDGTRDSHFIVLDLNRDLIMVGAGQGLFRIDADDKIDEAKCTKFFSMLNIVTPMRVCTLKMSANRARETKFNTPDHYDALAANRVRKLEAREADEARCSGKRQRTEVAATTVEF